MTSVRMTGTERKERIVQLLKEHPEGLDAREIQEMLGVPFQQQFDRRIRELRSEHTIETKRVGVRTVYLYGGPRPEGVEDQRMSSGPQRVRILTRDGSRCQMCGRTPAADKVALHVDHKIPRSWGGRTEDENLWTLCAACNEGKKDYFASFDDEVMAQIAGIASVHERIAKILHLKQGEWVDCDLLEFVANMGNHQTDWRKRLRELRYLGLEITSRRVVRDGRSVSQYRLSNWPQLPEDLSRAAADYERARARRSASRKSKR